VAAPGGRLRVDVNGVHRVASRMRMRAADFITDKPPEPGSDEDWPSQQSSRDLSQAHHGTNQRFHQRMNDTADAFTGAADAYAGQEQTNGQTVTQMSTKDSTAIMTSVIKDLSTTASGVVGPLTSGLAGGTAALGSAVASGVGAAANAAAQVGGVMATTQAKLNESAILHPEAGAGAGGIAGGGGGGGDQDKGGQTRPAAARGPVPHTSVAASAAAPATGASGDMVRLGEREGGRVVGAGMPLGLGGIGGHGGGSSSGNKPRMYHVVVGKSGGDVVPAAAPGPVTDTTVVSVKPQWSKS
jgi:hypothetical protein